MHIQVKRGHELKAFVKYANGSIGADFHCCSLLLPHEWQQSRGVRITKKLLETNGCPLCLPLPGTLQPEQLELF